MLTREGREWNLVETSATASGNGVLKSAELAECVLSVVGHPNKPPGHARGADTRLQRR